jgi:ribosomal protein S18 acetylase RimI-like enzyme
VNPPRAERSPDVAVRAFVERDFDDLVTLWHETNLVSYRYNEVQQKHTLSDARDFFRDQLLPACHVLVATRAEQLLGMLALQAPWIRHLAVFPEHQRKGVGTLLLRHAREHAKADLRLYTFQRNAAARAFYERHGFVAVAFGVSPAPESEPDVEYRWSPRA